MPRERNPFPQEDAAGYDPADPYADKVALTDHRHYMLGRYFVTEAKAKILREELKVCYATHGVNHFEKCEDHRARYLEAVQAISISWMDSAAWRPVQPPTEA